VRPLFASTGASRSGFLEPRLVAPESDHLDCHPRLLTHRSFKSPLWLEHLLAILGICCLEDSPARWVAVHRIHHAHSDEQPDPHSPLVTFLWSHFGWLMVNNRDAQSLGAIGTFAKDLLRDPFYMRIEKRPWILMWIGLAQVPAFFLAGLAIGWLGWGREAALPLAASLVVWGVFVRIVAVWHITWSVNSLSHLFGYRNYETGEGSRNNWFVALLTVGEGWHNHHHEDPSSASVQHRWWEIESATTRSGSSRRWGWRGTSSRHVTFAVTRPNPAEQ